MFVFYNSFWFMLASFVSGLDVIALAHFPMDICVFRFGKFWIAIHDVVDRDIKLATHLT